MGDIAKYASVMFSRAATEPTNYIFYFNDEGEKIYIMDSIKKILKKNDTEYVLLDGGLEIEITKIYSVDGDISPHHGEDYFACDCV